MSANISALAIRRPIPVIVLFFVLTVLGILSFNRLPINADPNVNFPVVTVTVTQSGTSPDELENSVTRRIEDAVAGMANVRHITSTISEGQSVTSVEFALETDSDRAVNDVRNAVSQIRSELPQSIDSPIVDRMDVEGGAILYYALNSPNLDQTELAYFIDNEITRALLATQGVQQVTRLGGEKREIRVLLDPASLNSYGLTAVQVHNIIAQTNANIAGGRAILSEQEQSIRVLASSKSLEALKELSIAISGGRRVKLSQIADIIDSHAEVRSKARLNGKEVLAFNVSRTRGSSDTVVANGVQNAIKSLNEQHADINISEIYSLVDNTKENYNVAISTLVEGAFLTVLIVFLFLRSWRATLVAAISLPLSILPAFAVMDMLGYTLNSISLLALTLVVGILVDDAIVEIENIERHLSLGKRPYKAALDASDAIGFAVIAISLTIVAVFMPVSFISGVVGQYFSQFGVTVSVAVLASLLVARLATPLLATYILAPHAHKESIERESSIKKAYVKVLEMALKFRKTSLMVGVLLFILSLMLVPLLPTGFVPKADIGSSQINITLPPSSTLAQTDARFRELDKLIREHEEVNHVFMSAGGDETNKGWLLVRLKPHNERSISQKEFEDRLGGELAKFADMRFSFSNEYSQRDISIMLSGNDPATLKETAIRLKAQMREVKGVANPQINAPLAKTELQVSLLANEAAKRGVTPQAVGDLLRIATVGDTGGTSARFNLLDRQIPIRVTLKEEARNDIEILRSLRVDSTDGSVVSLNTVATLSYGEGLSSIERFDRERRISVDADLVSGYTIGGVLGEINALEVMKNLPAGVKVPEYGDAEYMNEMFEQFGLTMGFGVMMVFVVLVLLFKDFLQPLTILVAMPLSIGGVIAGLLAYKAALDLAAVIGILMLMGIVTKNSILLVDFVIEKRAGGMARLEALINSGKERARPIIMTTIAMVAGMLPAVFASGSGAAFRAPMAVAVICGLIASTLLSLVFVPVVYSLMDDFKNFLLPRLARLTSVTKEDKER
ncbi:efflux RND transporter permease subunit [Campylobacter sp. RM9344]|uniref:Efflux RND transporter permease subunit n=1 Tax=Campylobacter californiensis TaxID=1032243 RepID=A0AAW3ZTC5_9BACT|nr:MULTISPECIES: efflux RND transporter permease subunit [unclassified Campylobacter]MBE2984972.1 efflux RND transporter permease subunit [Campylobacter sp. RM6883]MBE2995413.1 efflux RND transporter permease subunit [Campylobacter sp. RM6913]MBE3030202.1 efflux RND transporter permease subunit [Campylobacter sp. RM9344]MBE3608614.1 efflux RND transporter permease subunit [Campylobacter sp. RM9337]QCD49971.1 RND family efflux transporter, membrane subunit [Campylobacter sp. RM6914]